MKIVKGVLLVSNLMILFGSIWFIVLLVGAGGPSSYSIALQYVLSFLSFVVGLILHVGSALLLDYMR